jgi:hypothetical protein
MQEISFTTGTVTSRDGTKIGYRQSGHGPGIVLVQGAMGTASGRAKVSGFRSLAGVQADPGGSVTQSWLSGGE